MSVPKQFTEIEAKQFILEAAVLALLTLWEDGNISIAQQVNFQTSRQDPLSMSGAKTPPKHATSHHLQSNVMLTSSFREEVMAVFSQFGSRSLKQSKNWGVAKTKV